MVRKACFLGPQKISNTSCTNSTVYQACRWKELARSRGCSVKSAKLKPNLNELIEASGTIPAYQARAQTFIAGKQLKQVIALAIRAGRRFKQVAKFILPSPTSIAI